MVKSDSSPWGVTLADGEMERAHTRAPEVDDVIRGDVVNTGLQLRAAGRSETIKRM